MAASAPKSVRLRASAGLSLLEVLVSLAAAALFLGLMLPAANTALRRMQLASLEADAIQLARNQVEKLSAWPAAEPTPNTGTVGRLTWSVKQIGVDGAQAGAPAGATLRTFQLRVQAAGEPQALVDMTVQRLGGAP